MIFIFDADTYIDPEQLWAACYLAKTTGCLVVPFTRYVRLSESYTRRVMNGEKINPAGCKSWTHHASGALALPVSLWRTIGGYDERFYSWGGEDRSFYHACNAAMGLHHAYRLPGNAFHIWHPESPQRNKALQAYKDMVALGARYKRAAGRNDRTGCLPVTEGGKVGPVRTDEVMAILLEVGGPLNHGTVPLGRACNGKETAENGSLTFRRGDGKIVVAAQGSPLAQRLSLDRQWRQVLCT